MREKSMPDKSLLKIILLPGNGDCDMETTNWYKWVADELRKRDYQVISQNMPDPEIARKDIWFPFVVNELKADKNTIIIGHSSGGVAALRLLEDHQLLGAIVIGVNYTDLDDEMEKQSGYYDVPWQWQKIKQNAEWIAQFASLDDPYIPIEQPRFIHQQLESEYHEYTDQGHFGSPHEELKTFPKLIEIIEQKVEGKYV
jgi:predicted alpha/beta hydrolase family esterase